MFEILDRQNPNKITVFSDNALQSVLDDLYNYQKAKRDVIPAQQKADIRQIIGRLDKSEYVFEAIYNKRKELEEKISQVKDDQGIQDEIISESQNMIKQARIDYTRAVIASDDNAIDQVENKINQYSINISHAEIRKKAYQETLDFIDSVLKSMRIMEERVQSALVRVEFEELHKKYREHLLEFSEHFKAFHKTVRSERFMGFGDLKTRFMAEIHKELGL